MKQEKVKDWISLSSEKKLSERFIDRNADKLDMKKLKEIEEVRG